ncbi:2-oxoglutarate and iron-dependent oxygenase domain-containing protein CP2 (Protein CUPULIFORMIS 2) [Durusdinium trenchii]
MGVLTLYTSCSLVALGVSKTLQLDDFRRLRREASALLGERPSFLRSLEGPRRLWGHGMEGVGLGRPEIIVDIDFQGATHPQPISIRLYFSEGKINARWLLPSSPRGEDKLKSFMESLLRGSPLSHVVPALWEQVISPEAPWGATRSTSYRARTLHRELYGSWLSFLDPNLLLLLKRLQQGSTGTHTACGRCVGKKGPSFPGWRQLFLKLGFEEISRGVYAFQAMTPRFCSLFLQELSWFEHAGLRRSRPNSMNKYGTVLDEMDLSPMIAHFQQQVLQPLSRLLFPGIGDELDGHHAFVVRYRVEGAGDMDLAPHRDDSEVTFNLALGRRWAGCELTFCGLMQDQDVYHHRLSHKFPGEGWAVLHLGRQVHGTEKIRWGERANLVIWSRSWAWRAAGRIHV